ncbi:hemolysin TlyA family protein [Candidatus Magnetobacterium bavaricum]|uniref:Hemolysin TlyA family protein n=1 Tax=Candidatus Magnetobacterium bavaricum TaxID=29290 RepID=A0A0F3GWV0_9BACT|nr:hemolysin TlyA family protein [Candidatus Magnetobacterium bavaricum]
MKKRLDSVLVERGLVSSRERARALIMENKVLVNGAPCTKPGVAVDVDTAGITLRDCDMPYVSRGGMKLDFALEHFNVDVGGMTALDVGASTGGFTDCLLVRGALRVYAVDVGYGQLAWRLRSDNRVIPIERTNIRYMDKAVIPEDIDISVVDVSFISLKIVIPAVLKFLGLRGKLVCLIKPQFEVGKGAVGKGGIVREEEKRIQVVQDLEAFIADIGLDVKGVCQSPIQGQKGNTEYLLYAST